MPGTSTQTWLRTGLLVALLAIVAVWVVAAQGWLSLAMLLALAFFARWMSARMRRNR